MSVNTKAVSVTQAKWLTADKQVSRAMQLAQYILLDEMSG